MPKYVNWDTNDPEETLKYYQDTVGDQEAVYSSDIPGFIPPSYGAKAQGILTLGSGTANVIYVSLLWRADHDMVDIDAYAFGYLPDLNPNPKGIWRFHSTDIPGRTFPKEQFDPNEIAQYAHDLSAFKQTPQSGFWVYPTEHLLKIIESGNPTR